MSSDVATDFTGTERFRLVRRIGAGGMGVVYEAEDRERGTRVALKTLPGFDATALYRFKREFRGLADVSHPNLVTLYELHSVGSHWFFTMELVDGIDFLSFVRGTPPPRRLDGTQSRVDTDDAIIDTIDLPVVVPGDSGAPAPAADESTATVLPRPAAPAADPVRLRAALVQLAAGIAALHAAGKLHRDLKPSNVLVRPDGRVVILDFGLATDLEEGAIEQRTELLAAGTVSYMAPEQAAGTSLTPAADWYAFGTMLYQALTGRLPFAGTAIQVMLAKQGTAPPPPRALSPDAPDDLDRLCAQLLATRPTERPDGAAVINRLGGGAHGVATAAAAPPAAAPRGAFVGRQRQMVALGDAFAESKQGHAVTVFVHGRSGVGKSFLVQRFLEEAHRDGAVVLAGRCFEQESVPYKAFDSLVDSLSRHLRRLPREEAAVLLPRDVMALARLFPVLRRVEAVNESSFRARAIPDPQELRRRAFGALRELFARLGDSRPLVLAIDDLQWGDLDSAALLLDLLRPPDAPQLLLVGSYRSEHADSSDCLAALLQAGGEAPAPRIVAVEPLDCDEAAALAAELLGVATDPPDVRAELVARESGGVPFFIQELVRHIQSGAELGGEAGGATASRISLDDMLWSRARRLDPAARQLLEVVAVAGRPLRQADAYRAAGLTGDVSQALQSLRAGHFVRSTGPGAQDQIDSYHDRVREVVVQRLPAAGLTAHHRDLALTLEASGHADPETLAVHFERAGERAKAGHYAARAAAAAAEALAFDRAATLFRTALEQRPPGGEPERALRVGLADALANAGHCLEAAREYQRAAVGADDRQVLDLERRAAFQYTVSGHATEGREAFGKVLGVMGIEPPSTPRRALVHLLFNRARLWFRGLSFTPRDPGQIPAADLLRIDTLRNVAVGASMFDPVIGRDFQTRSTIDSLRAGEPGRIALALAWEAVHSACDGIPARRQTARYLSTARAIADRTGQAHALGMAAMAEGGVAFLEGRFREAVQRGDEAERILRERCTGVTWELDTSHNFTLWSLLFAGDLAPLRGRVAGLFQEAKARGDLYAEATLGTYIAMLAALPSGETEEAREQMRQLMARWPADGYTIQQLDADYGEFYADFHAGRGADAWARVPSMWRRGEASMVLRVQLCRIESLSLSARAALHAAGEALDPKPLLAAAEGYARRLHAERTAWATPLAELALAGVAALRGDTDRAAGALSRGIAGADANDMTSFAAAGRWRLAALLGGDAGADQRRRADAWMTAHSVRDPERVVECFVPGFVPR